MNPLPPVSFFSPVSAMGFPSLAGAAVANPPADAFRGEMAARPVFEGAGLPVRHFRGFAEILGTTVVAASLALSAGGADSWLASEADLSNAETGLVVGGLVVFASALAGLVAYLKRPSPRVEFTIGREPGNGGLLLSDPTVSSQQAAVRFERKTGRFWVRHTGGTNATILKRGWVEKAVGTQFVELQSGDTLRLGLAEIRFLPPPLKAARKEPRSAFQRAASVAVPQRTLPLTYQRHYGDPWVDNRRRIEEERRQEELRAARAASPKAVVSPANDEKAGLSRQFAAEAAEIEKAKIFSHVDDSVRGLLEETVSFLRYRSFSFIPAGEKTRRVEGVNAAELMRGQNVSMSRLEVELVLAFARASQVLRAFSPFNLISEMARVREILLSQEDALVRQEAVRLMSQRLQTLDIAIGLEPEDGGNAAILRKAVERLRRERDLLAVGRAEDLCRDVGGRIVDALLMGYVEAKRKNPVVEKLFQTRLNSRPNPHAARKGFDELDDFGSITSANYLAAAMNVKPFEISDLVAKVLSR